MRAEIISVGTELLMGRTINTDASYLSVRLAECGVYVYYHTVVGDNEKRLEQCLNIALDRVDVVILTGGLGPTQDDLTKETVAKALGLNLVFHKDILENIQAYFNRMKRDKKNVKMSDNNIKQAYYPEGSIIIPNNNGTASGCLITKKFDENEKTIIMLPGPPWELEPMVDEFLLDYFLEKNDEGLESVYLRLFGIGESAMEEIISDILYSQSNPTIAPYAQKGEVMIRITARYDKRVNNAKEVLEPTLVELEKRLSDYIYAQKDIELKDVTGNMLIQKNVTLSCAESCTGGMLSSMLTDVPGISSVFTGSIIAYSNEIKNKILGVDVDVLEKYGAVSEQTAVLMAEGVRKLYNTRIGISITGIAGPKGATPDKPVGLVYIALSTPESTVCHEFIFGGNRDRVRNMSSLNALNMIRKYLLEKETY